MSELEELPLQETASSVGRSAEDVDAPSPADTLAVASAGLELDDAAVEPDVLRVTPN